MRTSSVVGSILVTVLFAFSDTALARTVLVAKVPQQRVCQQAGNELILHDGKFLGWLLDDYGVSLACIDANDDGDQTITERQALITGGAQSERCTKQDSKAIYAARDFVEALLRSPSPYFEVRKKKGHIGDLTSDALFGNPSTLSLMCRKADVARPKEPDPVGSPLKLSEAQIFGWKVKLRGDHSYRGRGLLGDVGEEERHDGSRCFGFLELCQNGLVPRSYCCEIHAAR